ncbi:hypothetical protein [Oceanobacillus bengalensis]|uniref:hypothetical protein n=1 Tax=Oceanobacillus bengalensis TaxID=1435466 RepID=UPI0011C36C4F|nr:hypothetical protein [Oceanobacillus bengalensis]
MNDSHYITKGSIEHNCRSDVANRGQVIRTKRIQPIIKEYRKKEKRQDNFVKRDILASNGVTHTVEMETKFSEKDCVSRYDNREAGH